MKNLAVLVLASCLFVSCTMKKKAEVKSNEQKVSYAIGQQIGSGIKSQGLQLDVDVIAMAIEDVLKDKAPRISEQEMQQALQNMQMQMMSKRMEEGKKNKEDGEKFLKENQKNAKVKVTKSGLQYEVITEGKGAIPKETDVVKVHYRGTLTNGTEFDSSYKRGQPAEFPVKGVIKGWTEALQLMKMGSKYKLYVPSDLAYGESGRPGIPPNAVLIFEVELLEIKK